MTGGSLPAMVWKRLMAYAHQNVELKPIPGIEHPFVDDEVAAAARKAEGENGGTPAEAMERPPGLSLATARVLRSMAEAFRAAPVIEGPAEPRTLSAL
jgi:penicillin-binding protein 1A